MRNSLRIPAHDQAQVWLDFDGTITQEDVLDKLIERYAVSDRWKLIEQRWQAGLIGSRQCLQQEFDEVRISDEELPRFLDTIGVDPGIFTLLSLLSDLSVPAHILSDGVDLFIRHVLGKNGILNLPSRSNSILRAGDTMKLACPHSSDTCESAAAHCKCASTRALNPAARKTIYVGDGRSDLCPARKADLVFAKSSLAKSLAAEHIPFIPFTTLDDVASTLSESWLPKVMLA